MIQGETLRERLKREPIDLREALKIIIQITAALGAAHDAGIIHRDIKPENVMIRSDGVVKVLDFGLAKLSPLSTASVETTMPQINTKPGVIVGTIAYMSPEQARGRSIDPRSDIFSLGIVMFEIFTGGRPFDGESQLELISSILKDEPPRLRELVPDIPKELDRIVQKALRKDLDHRYQHVKDLHIDLDDLADEIKFESKLPKNMNPTLDGVVHVTNHSNFRSAFTTGFSKTRRFTALHAMVFLTVVVGAVGVFWYLRPSAQVAADYKMREVASWAARPGELFGAASFSPDGKMIAFDSTRSGSKGIWVTQTNATDAIAITNDVLANSNPIWSPAGDEIAYISRGTEAGVTTTSIRKIGALGGTPRVVKSIEAAGGTANLKRWAASGKIYYETRGDIFSVDLSTGGGGLVAALSEKNPSWVDISPDEKSVAFAVTSADEWQIFTADVGGTKQNEIARGRGTIDPHIVWSSELGKMYFTATIDGTSQMFVTTAGTFRNDRLAIFETDNSVVDVASDGRSILLSSAKEESNIWRVSLTDGKESVVARDVNAKLWPSAASDGERVAYQSIKNLSPGSRLFKGSSVEVKTLGGTGDAGKPVVVSDDGALPTWSPDGNLVAFINETDKKTEIYVADPKDGIHKRIGSFGKLGVGFSASPYNTIVVRPYDWSPDGNYLAYVSEEDGVANVMIAGVRNGELNRLTSNQDADVIYSSPIWSPDGKRIAFSWQRRKRDEAGRVAQGLKVVALDQRSVVDVLDTTRIIKLIGWTADETSLVFVESDKANVGLPPETNLFRIPAAGGEETSVLRLKNAYVYNIFLSKDRKQLAYVLRENELDSLWVAPSAGGAPRRLTTSSDSATLFSRMAWMPDGNSILFGKQVRFSILSMMTGTN